jgi:hypothetical protein
MRLHIAAKYAATGPEGKGVAVAPYELLAMTRLGDRRVNDLEDVDAAAAFMAFSLEV